MNYLITEKLSRINNARNDEEQINLLQQYRTPAFAGLLKINYNPEINFLLPEGDPPYRKFDKPLGIEHSYLEVEYRNFGYFLEENNMAPMKREQLFIDVLERLYPTEAEALIAIRNHSLKDMFPNIKKKNVLKAFWNMDIDEEEEEVKSIDPGQKTPETGPETEIITTINDSLTLARYEEILSELYFAPTSAGKFITTDLASFKRKLADGSYGFTSTEKGVCVLDLVKYLYQKKY